MGVRNLEGFNKKVTDAAAKGESITDPIWQPDPLSLIDIDDQVPPDCCFAKHCGGDRWFADMIMIVGKKVEQFSTRLLEGGAAGIHLVLATQRHRLMVLLVSLKRMPPYCVSSVIAN